MYWFQIVCVCTMCILHLHVNNTAVSIKKRKKETATIKFLFRSETGYQNDVARSKIRNPSHEKPAALLAKWLLGSSDINKDVRRASTSSPVYKNEAKTFQMWPLPSSAGDVIWSQSVPLYRVPAHKPRPPNRKTGLSFQSWRFTQFL